MKIQLQRKTVQNNPANTEKHYGLSDVLNVFKLLGTLGSGIVVILTAVRAFLLADYYGIPFVNLININITFELIIKVIPVVLIAGTISSIMYMAKCKEVFFKNWIADLVAVELMLDVFELLSVVAILVYSTMTLYNYLPNDWKDSIVDNEGWLWLNCHSCFMIIVFTVFAVLIIVSKTLYLLSQIRNNKAKKKEGKAFENILCIYFVFIVIIYIVCVFCPFGIDVINQYCNPSYEKDYEIVTLYDEDGHITNEYVTICNNSNGIMVMESIIDRESKTLTISKDHYKYLKPDEKTDFKYLSFEKVIIENNIKNN